LFIVLTDIFPISSLIACIHIGAKGEWDCLLAVWLKSSKEDLSTDAGSHMLDELKSELKLESLLGSDAFPDDQR
jgi:hypothetical protein